MGLNWEGGGGERKGGGVVTLGGIWLLAAGNGENMTDRETRAGVYVVSGLMTTIFKTLILSREICFSLCQSISITISFPNLEVK